MDKKHYPLLLVMGALFILTGCQPSESKEEKSAIEKFRAQLAASQYHEIYTAAAPALQSTVSEEKLTEYLKQFKLTVGSYSDGSAKFYEISTTHKVNGPSITHLYYHSSFTKYASVNEGFSFEENNDNITLAGYTYKADTGKPLESAEEEAVIAQFRTRLAASQYHEIYTTAATELKVAISEEDLTKVLAQSKSALGTYNNGSAKLYKRGLFASTHPGKPPLDRLNYHSSFSQYPSVDEEFTFEETDGSVKLAGYSFTSSAK